MMLTYAKEINANIIVIVTVFNSLPVARFQLSPVFGGVIAHPTRFRVLMAGNVSVCWIAPLFLTLIEIGANYPRCNWQEWSPWSDCGVCGGVALRNRGRGKNADLLCAEVVHESRVCDAECSM